MTDTSASRVSAKFIPKRLAILLIVFGAVAIFYSVIIPLFEGPDEDDHFRLAKFIADTHALPVQLFEPGGGAAGHQGWQPPLYYALVAALITPIDTSDYSQHLWRNYAATFVGDPACCGRNIYYHTTSENFPYTQTPLAVHLARVLSILFGALTVAATYKLTEIVLRDSQFANRDLLPLAAAAVVAFNPSFLFASALVSNDAPLAAFSALVLLLWVKLLVDQTAPTLKSAALLGVLIGLALLTKTTALGLAPLSVIVLLLVARRERSWRYAVLGNAVMLAVIALLAGWWFVRNQILYGDPLALRLVAVASLFPRAGPLTLPELFSISLPWMWQTFWGGPTPGDFSPVLLGILAFLTALALIGMIRFVVRASLATRLSLALLAAWLGFIFIAQIQFIQTTIGADQGRYLFPAIAVIALFFVLGLTTLVGRMTNDGRRLSAVFRHSSAVIIVLFFALALFVPLAYTLPAYAPPALASESDLARASHPLQVNFDNRIELRGYDLGARAVKQGDTLRVTLYWRARAPMSESYRVFVHLIGLDNRFAGGADVIPARGAFPTVYWQPGDIVRDDVLVPVAANALPGKYTIEVGLYPVGQPGARLATVGSDDDRALLDAVKVAAREAVAYAPQVRVGATFADKAELIGYDARVQDNALRLTLYWQSLAPFDRDYTVFVHLLDRNGKSIAQQDQQPQAGNYPTSIWDTGEQIRDDYTLPLPPNAPLAQYHLELGMYRQDTGERLPIRLGNAQSDHLDLNLSEASP